MINYGLCWPVDIVSYMASEGTRRNGLSVVSVMFGGNFSKNILKQGQEGERKKM